MLTSGVAGRIGRVLCRASGKIQVTQDWEFIFSGFHSSGVYLEIGTIDSKGWIPASDISADGR